ncbi:hypothetical protein H5410_033191 [Solanum commersonii]|uniref:Uncharacterized protein n=1 Tax=Solanum commersonii TaxID=4109 RepID=A0A9J5YPF8_SOLCO|nr:hypothetical protein H5410_033191 [Solanum commersonii]
MSSLEFAIERSRALKPKLQVCIFKIIFSMLGYLILSLNIKKIVFSNACSNINVNTEELATLI